MDSVSINLEWQWEAVAYRRPRRTKPLMRVFQGGLLGNQMQCFGVVAPPLSKTLGFDLEVITVKDVNDWNFTVEDFVNYFLASDIHIILAHPHQGLTRLGWDMEHLSSQLRRLHYHKGFPTKLELECPVFLQNKYDYLAALGSFANPTLRIYFNRDNNFEYLRDVVSR